MRNLTIKREKSFIGCAMKMKIFIEDEQTGDTTINGVRCRKIGDLKNGEEKTFEIGDNAARVYAIADGLSKGYCNEFYPLPEGTDDIALSGKNKFNPANGNAFRFNDNNSPEVLENRKKNAAKGGIILGVAAAIGFILGFVLVAVLL